MVWGVSVRMLFLEQLDIGLFNVLVASKQTPTLLIWFGIICAKLFIYIIPLHLLILWFFGGRIERQTALSIVISVAVGLLCSHLIGHVFYRPRPFVAGLAEALISHKDNASFPSNHALIFTIYATTLYLYRYKTVAKVALVLAILTCWARIFSGVHYPFDIIGGFVLGLVMCLLVKRFFIALVPEFVYHIPRLSKQR